MEIVYYGLYAVVAYCVWMVVATVVLFARSLYEVFITKTLEVTDFTPAFHNAFRCSGWVRWYRTLNAVLSQRYFRELMQYGLNYAPEDDSARKAQWEEDIKPKNTK